MEKTSNKSIVPPKCGKRGVFMIINTRKTQNNEACPCGKRNGNRPMKFKNCCKTK